MNNHNQSIPRTILIRLLALTPATVILLTAACDGSGAASGTPQERVQQRIKEAVEFCQDQDLAAAANYFTYRGSDRERKYKDTYDASDESERRGVERACNSLLREASPSPEAEFEFAEYEEEQESEGIWHIQKLIFPAHPDADPLYVAMLEIEGRMVIGDLD